MKWKNAFYSCYLGSLIIVAHFFSLFSTTNAACTFPKKWFGAWFQSEVQNTHIVIDETFFGSKGSCVETVGSDQYIIETKEKNLYQCLLINLQHDNVIQYKETVPNSPEPEKTLSSLCQELSPDLTLFSMFRVDAKPISCPFANPPFTFYYSRGEATCSNPVSKINACADNSKLLLHYSACTDVKGSESTTEELTCVGVWKSGSSNYFVAKVHDKNEQNPYEAAKFKCYLYETIGQGSLNTGYRIAQSEGSCTGLSSIAEGSTVMTLTREEARHTNCQFPPWIAGKTWRALNSGIEYNFASSNATRRTPSGEETVVCHSIETSEEMKYSYIVVKVMSGCDAGYKCVLFQRRDGHIIEMQEAPSTEETYSEVCSALRFDPATVPLVTYVTANFPPRKCPPLPRLVSVQESKVCKDKSYHQISIGCGGKPERVEFKPPESCTNFSAAEFMCHGHWEAKKVNSTEAVGYIIGSPYKTADDKYVCFSYTKKNDIYQLRATAPTCYEPKPMFTFQLKSAGECRSEDSGRGDSEDDDGVNVDSKCATLAISAFHFFIAYLLSVYVR